MSDITIFKSGLPAYLKELVGEQDDTTTALAGGEGGQRRISIKGGAFREMIGTKEVRVSEDRAMNVIIIKAAPTLARAYYSGAYVEGENASPACWSSNTVEPSVDVPAETKQARRCADCPQNIKGSGQGDSRACRYHQRIAVLLEGGNPDVYQIICPATSVFGEGEQGKMPLQAYGRYLKAHNTPAAAVVTEMRFDINSPTPKLTFKPVRPITEEEFKVVQVARVSPEADAAIKFTVVVKEKNTADMFAPPPAEKPKAVAAPKVEKVEPAPAPEPEPEPVKVESKKAAAPAPAAATKLADLVSGWDD